MSEEVLREDFDDVGAAADLAVEALQRIGASRILPSISASLASRVAAGSCGLSNSRIIAG